MKENFKLFGAIVDTPEGKLFFKMTGPAKTVQEPQRSLMR